MPIMAETYTLNLTVRLMDVGWDERMALAAALLSSAVELLSENGVVVSASVTESVSDE